MKESLIKMFIAYICVSIPLRKSFHAGTQYDRKVSKSIEKSWVDFLHVKLIFQVITFI